MQSPPILLQSITIEASLFQVLLQEVCITHETQLKVMLSRLKAATNPFNIATTLHIACTTFIIIKNKQ